MSGTDFWFRVAKKALNDWRIRRLAKALGVSYGDAFHLCSTMWCELNERGGGLMAEEEVDDVVARSGFGSALLASSLAEATQDGRLRIKGDERAEKMAAYRAAQKARSELGVRARLTNIGNGKDNEGPHGQPLGHPVVNQVVNQVVNPGSSSSKSCSSSPSDSGSLSGSTPESIDVATYLDLAIKTHTPSHRGKPSTWVRDIDLALRLDGRTAEELCRVVDYAHRNPDGAFWASNLLSGSKLRKHAERILITLSKAPSSSVAGGNDGGRVMTPDELAKWSLEQMAREREGGGK